MSTTAMQGESLTPAAVAALVQFLFAHDVIDRRSSKFRFRKWVDAFMARHDEVRVVGVSNGGVVIEGRPPRQPGFLSRFRRFFQKPDRQYVAVAGDATAITVSDGEIRISRTYGGNEYSLRVPTRLLPPTQGQPT